MKSYQGNLQIDIYDPNGNLIKNYINKINEYLNEIKYIPHKIGKYSIFVKLDGQEILSCPYIANIINPDKVTIQDDCQYFFSTKNIDLEINQKKNFCFNTTEAGEGDVRLEIIAPNNQLLPYRKQNQGQNEFKLSFCPILEGLYKIRVFFNNNELKFSPFVAKTSQSFETNISQIYGNSFKKAFVNQKSNFIIDLSTLSIPNENPALSVSAISTDSHILKFDIDKIQDNMYNCSFIPEKNGNYLLSTKLDQQHICGSPSILNVDINTKANKITLNTNDFKNIINDQVFSTIIDTCGAINGELSAICNGPTKSADCQFIDLRDGTYELQILAKEIGKHFLSLTYNDAHVTNSPFMFKVSPAPDASKVQVFGPGITHGVINDFKSNFICDTHGAGSGQLTVRIRGPKGAFRVDMQRKNEKERRIECTYDPLEVNEFKLKLN